MSESLSTLAGDDQRLGRLFTILGIGGLIASVIAGVLGIVVVVALTRSADQSLAVTVKAVETADETVALAADTLGIVSESFDTLVPSAELAAATFEDAATVIADSAAVVTVDVPEALDAVLAQVEFQLVGLDRSALIQASLDDHGLADGVILVPLVVGAEAIGHGDGGKLDRRAVKRPGDEQLHRSRERTHLPGRSHHGHGADRRRVRYR